MMCTTFLYPEEYALPERTKVTPTAVQATGTSLKKISRENQCLTGTLLLQGSLQVYSSLQVAFAILVSNCYVNYIVFDKL